MGSELAGMQCVGFAEIDKKLAARYQDVYSIPKRYSFNSVSEIIQAITESPELLLELQEIAVEAGFPCTPWSKSGDQTGKNHEKGMIFWEILELMTLLNSPFFIFCVIENRL